MAGGRFSRLIEHLRHQEDHLRGDLARIDQDLAAVAADRRSLFGALDQEMDLVARSLQPALREQLTVFSALCADRDMVFTHRSAELTQQRAQVQKQLVDLWRRRRSLETIDQRQLARERQRGERRQEAEVLDAATRAWYLHEMDMSQPRSADSVESDHRKVAM